MWIIPHDILDSRKDNRFAPLRPMVSTPFKNSTYQRTQQLSEATVCQVHHDRVCFFGIIFTISYHRTSIIGSGFYLLQSTKAAGLYLGPPSILDLRLFPFAQNTCSVKIEKKNGKIRISNHRSYFLCERWARNIIQNLPGLFLSVSISLLNWYTQNHTVEVCDHCRTWPHLPAGPYQTCWNNYIVWAW